MAEIVLFHHVQGLTRGVIAFAERLQAAGHTVHTPDLLEGRTFKDIETGMAHVESIGFAEVLDRGSHAVADVPGDLVYAGFSLGVLSAQNLAQTRPGARGALFYSACVPTEEFGPWPDSLPVQIHGMDADPFFVEEGDLDAARALAAESPAGELFLYPGDDHLFMDDSLPAYNIKAATLALRRTLAFLDRI